MATDKSAPISWRGIAATQTSAKGNLGDAPPSLAQHTDNPRWGSVPGAPLVLVCFPRLMRVAVEDGLNKTYFHSSIRIPRPNLKSVTNQVVWIFPPATTN
jgi:hypothetical protein